MLNQSHADLGIPDESRLQGLGISLVLGIVDPEGDFVELRYDARRFEPLEAKVD